MHFAVLGSGSRGNAYLVAQGSDYILIDCGFSLRELELRLARLGLMPWEISAILVSHEHSDHSQGVERFSRRYNVPVYLSHGTWKGMKESVTPAAFLEPQTFFALNSLCIMSVPVPHDARQPLQFVITDGLRRLGVLTDLGIPGPEVLTHYQELDALIIEANHDRDMLLSGGYPYYLKKRIDGRGGHMNNQQSAELTKQLGWRNLQHLVLAHLSEKNNQPSKARAAFVDVLDCDPDWIQIANQQDGLGWRQID